MGTRVTIVRLTARDQQIVQLVSEGLSNAQIAGRLSLRPQTVKNRLSALYPKLGVRSRTELAVALLRTGALR